MGVKAEGMDDRRAGLLNRKAVAIVCEKLEAVEETGQR